MDYECIIITGTNGAGKSEISRNLCSKYDVFGLIGTETQGTSQSADINNEIQEMINQRKIPILIGIPVILKDIINYRISENKIRLLTIFMDAPDDLLNERLMQRSVEINQIIKRQRQEDRTLSGICTYIIYNVNPDKTLDLIWSLWNIRMTGGVLSKRIIGLMIECNMLLNNAETENISSAAYDLSLGDEYYYGGRIRTLTDKNPFILIEPYDYAIVTSKEIANFPRNIIGRFDLSVSLFCQGIILSNGPQVDPGFKGRLFCLLFNTSNALIFLKRAQHYATIEFSKMVEPSEPYKGKYQDKDKIIYYLPSNTMRGAINELKKDVEQVKKEGRNLQSLFLAFTSLIVAIIALLLLVK